MAATPPPDAHPAQRAIDPATAFMVLSRVGYGPRPGDVEALMRQGYPAWLEAQLKAPVADVPEVRERLAALRLHIRYGANPAWPALDEMRPLAYLDKPIDTVWAVADGGAPMDGQERRRPMLEVSVATVLRAVYSPWGLRETMTQFWHDHFNVDAYSASQIAAALPSYDREVIRPNALGNFRTFLEAVATSAAMQFYLSNRTSRAGAANENYARELFELHTLGRDAYLNDKYDRWRQVPGALKGQPVGYIDQDVYEAARAFTGWTVADGAGIDGHTKLPRTGQFAYVDVWHDGYQKRVLATEFDAFQPARADGRKVLDLLAAHPATARFVVTKLVRRYVSDEPPERLVAAASAVWLAHRQAPDQIAQVMRVILTSPEFLASRGAKLRRPLALVAGFVRATGQEFTPNETLVNEIANAGQRLFGYPTPNGMPDDRALLITTNGMRRRWTLVLAVAENAWGTGAFDAAKVMPATQGGPVPTAQAAAAQWLARTQGFADTAMVEALVGGLGWPADQPLTPPGHPDLNKRLARIAAFAAMAPGFQSC
ncbi:MAG TPA: DUF1800 domain-containing protein [Stellaceae bacterium]|nr:DUF1800 domain-containing protein [Stellaceae bacterium]